jgi:heat shock protein HtpX
LAASVLKFSFGSLGVEELIASTLALSELSEKRLLTGSGSSNLFAQTIKMQTTRRILLFFAVNILVVLMLTFLFKVTQLDRRFAPGSLYGLMILCLIWGMSGAFISLALSRVLAKLFHGVRVISLNTPDPNQRELLETVRALARRAGLTTMPEVGYYESQEINAFATGPSRSRSLVAVSTGLLNNMRRGEVEGVLAHEVAHIANGDMVTMTLIQGVINAFVMFLARILAMVVSSALRGRDERAGGYWLQYMLVQVFQLLLSLPGLMIVCWFSRRREFRADAGGATYSSRSNMVGALRALQRAHEIPEFAGAGGPASFQSLKISSPNGFMRLFSTHPPLEERIAKLEARQ